MPLTRDQIDQLRRILVPLANRIANSSARLVVQLVDDSAMQQLLQVTALEGEVIDDGEHFQPYGFTAIPLPGAEGVGLFPNGDRGHPLVLVVSDRRFRPRNGEPGEVVVYNHTGAEVRLTDLGDIVLTPAAGRSILLGSSSASDPVPGLSALQDLADEIQTAPDGAGFGTALKTALAALYSGAGWPSVSTKAKVD